jgi:DMSO reductase family type II enzyme heme b subunit
MPAWKQFSDDELDALVGYIKDFAAEDFEFPGEPIEIPKTPEVTDEMIANGKELFEKAKCWECHGGFARGSGEKGQQVVKDEWGYRIFPADLTHPWELRNGSRVEDLYRTITTGISGTPMASYKDAYSDDERWGVAFYLKSIQFKRKLDSALTVKKVENIPTSTEDKLWDTVDYIDIPLAGQMMFELRHFTPTLSNVRVRSLYTDAHVAIMLEWTDKKPNRGDDGFPPDAVRVQLPVKIPEGAEKPYFYMGDKKNPVRLWYWDTTEDRAVEFIAKGYEEQSISRQEQTDVKLAASYNDGLYRVIFQRSIETDKQDDISFVSGKFIPFSVSVFDGLSLEQKEKNLASVSVWYYLMLEPPTPLTVFVLPPIVSLAVLGIGISLHRKLRAKSSS